MPLREVKGDLLISPVDVLVNPVNCVGVMGAGLAKQFREVYPEMFRSYQKACWEGDVSIGRMHVWPTGEFRPGYVVNFPTKNHWKDPSHISYVTRGLTALVKTLAALPVQSVALPALGCGLGGLDYEEVRDLIYKDFESSELDVWLFLPQT